MITFEQRRDFGEKINATFSFVTENIRGLGLAMLYIVGPVALIGGIMQGYAQGGAFNAISFGSPQDPDRVFEMYRNMLSPAFFIGVLFQLVGYVLAGLVTACYIQLYRRNPGRRIEVGEVWAEVQSFIGSGVLLSIASFFIVSFAMVLLIIPGIYVSVVLSLATSVLVFERTGVGEAISRCFKLITDKWWSTFGLIVVMSIVTGIVGMVFSFPAMLTGGLFGAGVMKDISLMATLTTAFAAVGGALLRALLLTALAFQYFNLVELKEGSGLDRAIDSIGQAPTRSDDVPASVRRASEEQGDY